MYRRGPLRSAREARTIGGSESELTFCSLELAVSRAREWARARSGGPTGPDGDLSVEMGIPSFRVSCGTYPPWWRRTP